MIKKTFSTTVEKGSQLRSFTFRVSTGDVDRDHDRIPPASWDISQFMANPVILWSHKHEIPPIGRARDVRIVKNGLIAEIEFPPPGIHPLADTISGLVAEGFLKATSVGFIPGKTTPNEFGGLDFQYPVELVEISPCAVPSNPGALLERGYDRAACAKWLGGRKESPLMSKWKPNDTVLLIDRAPAPVMSRWAQRFWHMREAQAEYQKKLRLLQDVHSVLPGNVLGRVIRIDDDELPEHLRWLPVARFP